MYLNSSPTRAFWLFVLFFVSSTAVTWGQPATKQEIKRTATNLVSFGIPFSISDPEDKYIEVQLYMSKNRGLSWQFYGRESTAAKEIPFTTKGDGVYWFALRTLDRDRRVHPEGPMNAELEVIVDSITPELDFRIQPDQAGRLVCRWTAKDEHIDPQSLKLSFRPLLEIDDRNNSWVPVSYRPVTEPQGGVFSDQYAWWPETSAREVLVQLQISDHAGNTAVEERQIVVPRSARISANHALAVQGNPLPAGQPGANSTTKVETLKPAPTTPSSQDQSSNRPSVVWHPGQKAGSLESQKSTAWPEHPDHRPSMKIQQPPAVEQTDPLTPVVPQGMQPIQKPVEKAENRGILESAAIGSTEAGNSSMAPAKPVRFTPPSDQATTSVIETPMLADTKRNIESVNSRRIRMNYALDQLDPALISKVVLWMTIDHGDTWSAYGEDSDNSSPFPIELTQPGLYGFRIVFHTVDGLAGRAPVGGDDADYWVRLDVDSPLVQLTGAPYGRGEHAGSLIVQWTASDDLLSEKPISLAYSLDSKGPWTSIAGPLENTGSFVWKVGAEVPPAVFLRVQVTDAAGNQAFSQTTQPIDLSGLIPKARILGVEKN